MHHDMDNATEDQVLRERVKYDRADNTYLPPALNTSAIAKRFGRTDQQVLDRLEEIQREPNYAT